MSLHKALGGGSSSEEEEEDEEPLSIWKGGRKIKKIFCLFSADAPIQQFNIPIICRFSQMETLIAALAAASVFRCRNIFLSSEIYLLKNADNVQMLFLQCLYSRCRENS